jgi:hypothetical protein
MSAFYQSKWKTWNPRESSSGVSVSNVAGMERSSADQYYSSQALGYRVILPWAKGSDATTSWAGQTATAYGKEADKWLFGNPLVKNRGSDAYEDVALTMPTSTKDDPESCTCFSGTKTEVTFSNGDCLDNDEKYCVADSMYTWKTTENKVRTNVANRMIQAEALKYAQTSGFTTIIVVQWADLMICKTRWLSIADQGMVNPLMNFGLLFETILGSMMCYFTPLGAALNTRPLRLTHWMPGMPFCIFIFIYDETRKYMMRQTDNEKLPEEGTKKRIGRWLKENTYY